MQMLYWQYTLTSVLIQDNSSLLSIPLYKVHLDNLNSIPSIIRECGITGTMFSSSLPQYFTG